jgi:hypothetical protein
LTTTRLHQWLRQRQNVEPLAGNRIEVIGEHEATIHVAPARGDALPFVNPVTFMS